jgi:class 3 adenylate cyclase
MPEDRRLAAIMFTDIVGYTTIMGENEDLAFEVLKKNRQIQIPIIEKHGGKYLKEMGDGILASFRSVSEAVYCAIEIQEVCEDDPDLQLRIGIHEGEVVFKDDDVFGNGVNITSRLQQFAPIGGIYVSESVHNNVLNKKSILTKYIREEKLKNVSEPVRIYEVKTGLDRQYTQR